MTSFLFEADLTSCWADMTLFFIWSRHLQGHYNASSRHLQGFYPTIHWSYQYKGFHLKPRESTTCQRPYKVITIIIHARVPWPFQRMTQGDQVQALGPTNTSKTSSKCHHATIWVGAKTSSCPRTISKGSETPWTFKNVGTIKSPSEGASWASYPSRLQDHL